LSFETRKRRVIVTTATEKTKQPVSPIVADFVASIVPVADLTEKGEAFRALTRQLLDLRERRSAIEVRMGEIGIALVDAVPTAAESLLNERALLAAEAASLPAQRGEVAKRRTIAQL
jgi:hypothetical protein